MAMKESHNSRRRRLIRTPNPILKSSDSGFQLHCVSNYTVGAFSANPDFLDCNIILPVVMRKCISPTFRSWGPVRQHIAVFHRNVDISSASAVAAWRGRRRVRGQGRARREALGVPLGEVWPNAGSSEAVRSENCRQFSDSVQLFAPGFCPMIVPHFLRNGGQIKMLLQRSRACPCNRFF